MEQSTTQTHNDSNLFEQGVEWFVLILLIVSLLLLIYQSVFGFGGFIAASKYEKQLVNIKMENANWVSNNIRMAIEVNDLKFGHELLEEDARNNFLLIKPGEDVYRFIEK